MAGLLQNVTLLGMESPWLSSLRKAGKDTFLQNGVPTAKVEAWKYTKPRELNADDYVIKQHFSACPKSAEIPFDCYRICFENGWFCPDESELPQGVEVIPLIEAAMFQPQTHKYFCGLVDLAKYPFAALNQAYLQEGVYIHIEKNVELKKPLVIINHTNSEQENLLFNLHNIIVLETGAEATLVEYYIYDGDLKSRYFTNVVNEIYLSPNSRFYHNKVQDEAFKADHIALNLVSAKKDSLYKSFCLQKGANIGRNETFVKLKEEGATAEVNATYIMNGWATLDTTTDIEHLSPYTYSHQLIKGVVGGNAKGVFQGKIHIAKDAIKTEGNQLHKALLLSDDAEVDVKPELEIFADDVKCSHGAASGELDENQLFYMRSRGIGLEEAKQILIDAYLDEVTTKIDNEKISSWIKLIAKENRK
ncbi:MAG: Fe-S cluster assembly protein SufD [Alphaproteobacteria bacterium]|nr:Fe-S cluster assembly protein SufD [Alphaproteobacteria bacterium]